MKHQPIASLWGQLYWLQTLAQLGSYTAAAERLKISKSAMSQHIAALERQAGVPLVQRTTRSVRLTEAGQRLVDQTRQPFEQLAGAFAQVRELAGVPSGALRITAPVAFARQQLVPRLPAFLQQYPGIRLELDLSDRFRSMGNEGFDLAVRHASSLPETHVALPLCKTRTLLVAAPAYLQAAPPLLAPGDLAVHNCLHYPRSQTTTTWVFERRTGRRGAQLAVPVSGCFSANNSEALRDAALQGLGVALLPDFTARKHLLAGELVELLPQWRNLGYFADTLYLLRPYSPYVPRALEALLRYIQGSFAHGFEKG